MDENDETPSNTHKEKQDLMQKALDDIMKNGPKLRLGHVPAPGKRFTNHYLLNYLPSVQVDAFYTDFDHVMKSLSQAF